MIAAASGTEARELLEKDRRFDLIFCDLMMSEMSGMELHAWLAEQDAKLAEQPVLSFSTQPAPPAADNQE